MIYFVYAFYVVAFVIGISGNVYVLILNTFAREITPRPTPQQSASRERSRFMIFLLVLADLGVNITLPFSLYQLVQAQWVFGAFMCRFMMGLEAGAKHLSIIILTLMSLERYLIVCSRWRRLTAISWFTLLPLLSGIIVSVPTIPWIYFTHLIILPLPTGQVELCFTQLPSPIDRFHTYYTLLLGFALPFGVMSLCYFLLVRHVRGHIRQRTGKSPNSARSSQPRYLWSLRRSVLCIVVWHGVCLGPWFFFTLQPLIPTPFVIKASPEWMLYSNLLVSCNSSGNWLLYSLNSPSRRHISRPGSRSRHPSGSMVTATMAPSGACSYNNMLVSSD